MWELFDGIYCINLPTRPEKWTAAQLQFEKVGLAGQVRRVDGVINESDTVAACKQAHLNVIKLARDNGLRNVLIFEDDVEFVHHDHGLIQDTLAQLRNIDDWGMFYLGSIPGMWKGQEIFGEVKAIVSSNILEVGGFYGAHAYALNRFVFDDVLAHADAQKEIDKLYVKYVAKNYRTLHVYPLLCKQAPGFSDIKKVKVRRHDSSEHLREGVARLLGESI